MITKWMSAEEIKLQKMDGGFSDISVHSESTPILHDTEDDWGAETTIKEYHALLQTDTGAQFEIMIKSEEKPHGYGYDWTVVTPNLDALYLSKLYIFLIDHIKVRDDAGGSIVSHLVYCFTAYEREASDVLSAKLEKRQIETLGVEFAAYLRKQVENIKDLLMQASLELGTDEQHETIEDSATSIESLVQETIKAEALGTAFTDMAYHIADLSDRFKELRDRVAVPLLMGHHSVDVFLDFRETFQDLEKCIQANEELYAS